MAAVVTAALICAGCSGSGGDARAHALHSPGAAATGGGSSSHHLHDAVPVTDARLEFEQLLGHHAILMIRLMRGPLDGSRAFTSAAQNALDHNTIALADLIGALYGAEAGTEYRRLWDEHIAALSSYSRAIAASDDATQARALSTLDGYAKRYGDFVEKATHGQLSSDAVAISVDTHIHHLMHATDAYRAKDYQQAFAMERIAFRAMFHTGKLLADAAVKSPSGELPVAAESPLENLESQLGRLLGEHAELAFEATRATVSAQPSASAAADALDQNTRDVLAAMRGAVGAGTAARFADVWAAHINALVAFTVGVAEDDDSAQARARSQLDKIPSRLSALLAPLSNGRVSATAVVSAFRQHDQQLLQQVTAYAAKDYQTSQDIASAGYDHMFAIADTLAAVLSGRSAATAPRGGAATGGGGLANS